MSIRLFDDYSYTLHIMKSKSIKLPFFIRKSKFPFSVRNVDSDLIYLVSEVRIC